ncbi:NAD-glutamate dehydrogenase [Hahella sp. HN01]|uniref:NAD-glutamate dehydrogenase n=1 Tax=Hahella sp. HN01 TaxID=2847262 RepID=UPI001C1EBE68|nr:NAD-glutamate dehydrogenase [Hahella sp. HN01]MBU6952978.1 NAD-glutamate dehydrogenase [Hahella sp. HN01]
MKQISVETREQFFELLEEEFKKKLEPGLAEDVNRFARLYLEMSPLDEIRSRRLADIYGAVVACWHFLQDHHQDQPKVTVFNPDLETHGWQSTHTVIGILHNNIPFIVDSVRMGLNRMELTLHSIQHAVLYIERDSSAKLKRVIGRDEEPARELGESMVYVEIDRHNDPADHQRIKDELETVLGEVRTAVGDYEKMKSHAQELISEFEKDIPNVKKTDLKEASEFLKWLAADHFTFLGYDEYQFKKAGKDTIIQQVAGSELGILKSHPERPAMMKMSDLPQKARRQMLQSEIFTFAKSSQRSRVHRPAYPDYVSVKKFNEQGEVIGERRFLGLYTSRVYHQRPDDIPLVRRKVKHVLKRSGFNPSDYAGKELDQILAVYPRDELFQLGRDDLFDVAMGILYIQERRKIRLFIREDVYGQFVSAIVYVPRDLYSTDLRLRISDILVKATGAEDVEFTTYFSESVLARTQFNLRVPQAERRDLRPAELEERIIAAAQSWQDGLMESLYEAHGEEQANSYIHLYANAFNGAYREEFSPRRAVIDIEHIASLSDERPLAMSFYRALEEDESILHFKLFHGVVQVPLSDVLPLFENLGLRVLGEHPFEAIDRNGKVVWIHDFSLQSRGGEVIDIQKIRKKFEELFLRVWTNEAENDIFNRLVLAAQMDWRQIAMLRAYARYMRQIRFSYSQDFIANTLVNHVHIAKSIYELFEARFNPAKIQSEAQCGAAQQKLEIEINQALDEVEHLSEDRVLRRFVELIKATLRTNYYQRGEDNGVKGYMSFKFSPRDIPEMPLPLPMFEIFVYSPRVEGVHLRGGKVARGGLRWSDRFEDYRTEVLGLVKAQQVKNSVIVPVGAKGGFVAKQLPENDREAMLNEGIACYKTFIRGLLDVTDNLSSGEVVPPLDVVRHDEDDYYLVVAADKGTATFSDIANSLSEEYNFWLGDAFASGGSQGYDHKKMGITARGGWVSVERHFREMGVNTATDDFTVVGVGDMSGDVFGNGMLRSEHILMVAAFNHMHIFIDPNPDAASSFAERKRLFELPRSTWMDYDSKLISAGGGIFSRNAKSIPISPEMKARFGIKQDRLPPNMLISQLLKAPVDLLWFGGIGTYVKSSEESHADVGDKANDALRVDASDLQVKVIGEGGNLGMTQLARIEYALNYGRLNTDFIDNAGGVDCSDHEVNIKILLNEIVAGGDMTMKQRNKLLADMTDSVADLVLMNNYRQTQALSIAETDAATRIEEYRRLINHLESIGKLNRGLEFIPDDETITERKSMKRGLVRPELCTLISYVKGWLKETLIDSDLVDHEYLANELHTEFPQMLVDKFGRQMRDHRLRREIIATQVANDMVNHMGITFVERLRQSTGAPVAAIAQAYVIARNVFQVQNQWAAIEALDYKVGSGMQIAMMSELIRLVRRATRWFLRNRRSELNVMENMDKFSTGIDYIAHHFKELLSGDQLKLWQERYDGYRQAGVPDELAATVAGTPYLYSALGIIEAQEQTSASLDYVARMFFRMGERLDMQWFGHQLNIAQPATHWQALARESFREDLDWQQRALTVGILRMTDAPEDIDQRIDAWSECNTDLIERWRGMLTELKATKDPEFPMYSVALRELLDLAQSTSHATTKI